MGKDWQNEQFTAFSFSYQDILHCLKGYPAEMKALEGRGGLTEDEMTEFVGVVGNALIDEDCFAEVLRGMVIDLFGLGESDEEKAEAEGEVTEAE